MTNQNILYDDRPIEKKKDDRLGYTSIARHLASSIVRQRAVKGLVFGIEGKWGSGKSSLINLTKDVLKRYRSNAPECVNFSPWLVGERDELIRSLFDEIFSAVNNIGKYDVVNRAEEIKKAKQLGQKLKRFGRYVGYTGKVVKAFGDFGIPLAGLVGKAIESTGENAQKVGADICLDSQDIPALSELKADVVGGLQNLSRKIVVFIDDLDRLEPREVVEVLRLIRAVADFPNVIYVLSYDPRIIADTVTKALRVPDGNAFLEKLVQVSFKVPRPEAFDLRRWFEEEVNILFDDILRKADRERLFDVQKRLSVVIDIFGGRYLGTPRDVVRTLNALRLHAVPVMKRIDISDMVWLQLVRLGNVEIYNWVEEYLVELAAKYYGATISPAEKFSSRLEELLKNEWTDIQNVVSYLDEILPTLKNQYLGDDSRLLKVFDGFNRERIREYLAEQRLASPEHYRNYFAFSEPAGSVPDERVRVFLDDAQDSPEKARKTFLEQVKIVRPQGGTAAEVLIDKILSWNERVLPKAASGIIEIFSDELDDAVRETEPQIWGRYRVWNLANALLSVFRKRFPNEISITLEKAFSQGRAIGWLSNVFRDEIFSHGYFGRKEKPESERLLSSEKFDSVRKEMLKRYKRESSDNLVKSPELLGVLYAWSQGGGEKEVKRWASDRVETDTGLLEFLPHIRSWSESSSDGVHRPLNRRELINFIGDADEIERRIKNIIENTNPSSLDHNRAVKLLEAIDQGRDNS